MGRWGHHVLRWLWAFLRRSNPRPTSLFSNALTIDGSMHWRSMQSFATTTISAGLSTYVSSAGEQFVRSCASETIRIRPVDLISKLGKETTGNNPCKEISSRRCVEVDRSMGSLDLISFFFGQSQSDPMPRGRPAWNLVDLILTYGAFIDQKYQSRHLHWKWLEQRYI